MSEIPPFATIQETFSLLNDWEDKYAYLIDLGRKLPAYPDGLLDPAHEVPGCLAKVWMDYTWQDGTLKMRLTSNADIVKGLLAVLMALYDGQTPEAITEQDSKARFADLGLAEKMTQNRRDGFVAVANRIRLLAHARLEPSQASV